MSYYTVSDDEWVRLKLNNQKQGCCECGLVHTIDFKIIIDGDEKQLFARYRKNKRATAALRRQEKKKK